MSYTCDNVVEYLDGSTIDLIVLSAPLDANIPRLDPLSIVLSSDVTLPGYSVS